MSVILETTKGDLTVDLYVKARPKTSMNFLKLCKIKSYNFNRFHHVERNFLCQTGDPTGTGRGGESIFGILYGEQARFYEAEQVPVLRHTKPGLLSMVNVGENMLGSQFFITLGENLDYLDKEHCVFGEVVEGHDALLSINDAICDENHIPYQDIRITHAIILDDPFDDPAGLRVPCESPEPTRDMVESGRIAADEEINEMEGKTNEEIEELIAEKEAKARATILEMVGDLPSIDAAPPENVLFVCKLNPVTTDDDLMIIFSRFGKIVSCEIIRDRLTGNSLQYAFIEFDNPKSCEDAYFKMDNVLIDDRRIHVDFSQSVSRIQWKGKGRGVSFEGGKAFDPNKVDYQAKGQRDGGQFKKPSHDSRSKRDEPHKWSKDSRLVARSPSSRDGERRDSHHRDSHSGGHRDRRNFSDRPFRSESHGGGRSYPSSHEHQYDRGDRNDHKRRRQDDERGGRESGRSRRESERHRSEDDRGRRDETRGRREHEHDKSKHRERSSQRDRTSDSRIPDYAPSSAEKRSGPPKSSSRRSPEMSSKRSKRRGSSDDSSTGSSSSSSSASDSEKRRKKSSKKSKKSSR